jgi:hypothetical protein
MASSFYFTDFPQIFNFFLSKDAIGILLSAVSRMLEVKIY